MKTVAIKKEPLTHKERIMWYAFAYTITFLSLMAIKSISYLFVNPNGDDSILYPFLLYWDLIHLIVTVVYVFVVCGIEFFIKK